MSAAPAGAAVRWSVVAAGVPRRTVADRLLVDLLSHHGVARPRIQRRCVRCGGDHGVPLVSDGGSETGFVASVAYASEWAVAAIAPAGAVFALDAEPRDLDEDSLRRLRTVLGDDRADATTWTRIEAALKADGRGLRVDPAEVRLSFSDGLWWARIPGRADSVLVSEVPGPPDVVVTVAAGCAAAAASDRSSH